MASAASNGIVMRQNVEAASRLDEASEVIATPAPTPIIAAGAATRAKRRTRLTIVAAALANPLAKLAVKRTGHPTVFSTV